MARAKMSVVPPGAKGTTILTGLLGQAVCAREPALDQASRAAPLVSSISRRLERTLRMVCLQGEGMFAPS